MSKDGGRARKGASAVCCGRRPLLRLATVGVAARLLPACAPTVAPDLPSALLGPAVPSGTDVTFFVAADTHLGADGLAALNRRQIAAMNELPGTSWPARSAGRVAEPRAVIVAGDLTESGSAAEWQLFAEQYGRTGQDGQLRFPVLLCTGNHDRSLLSAHAVLDEVSRRHGALVYGWGWDDVRFLCLDEYPSERTRRWLRRQLERMSPNVAVVLIFHYPLAGMLAAGWRPEDKEQLALSIVGSRVLGIFHGHYHKAEHYRWQRHDVYNPGSPKHRWHSFLAVRITARAMIVASWDWERAAWGWWHHKVLRPRPG